MSLHEFFKKYDLIPGNLYKLELVRLLVKVEIENFLIRLYWLENGKLVTFKYDKNLYNFEFFRQYKL